MTELPTNQKANAILTFPQNRTITVPLTAGAMNTWTCTYDARGENCGTAKCVIKGFDKAPFTASSGSTFVLSYPIGEKCPNCGSEVTSSFMTICSICGKTLPVI